MLFVIDCGNTNIVGGAFSDGKLVDTFRIQTVAGKTEDEYGVIVAAILRDKGLDPRKARTVLVSSVVPALSSAMLRMATHVFGIKPVLLNSGIYPCLPINVIAKDEIGPDLVANAVFAWETYRSASLVVDFGTALTFTALDAAGNICGVAIAPGLGTATASLSTSTARLPTVPLENPSSVLGKNTVQAIQAGVVIGYTGLVEHMVKSFRDELGDIKVLGTGGMCRVLADRTTVFDLYDPNLTLKGMAMISAYANCPEAR